jgi:hypothetical protein
MRHCHHAFTLRKGERMRTLFRPVFRLRSANQPSFRHARRPLLALGAAVIAAAGVLAASPAAAHHGKDFLLTATDDMPLRGHLYALLSADDTIDREEGRRAVEITPGLLFAVTDNFSLEPHVHIARQEGGNRYRYEATAIEARYRVGYLGGSQWRWGGLLEYEHPRGDAHDNLEGRLMFVRNFPRHLVALNLVASRDIEGGGRTPLSVIAGVLQPVSPSDNLGLEVEVPFPVADGVEILPGLYHVFGGPGGRTSLKAGLGLFVARDTTAGTFRTAFIQRF